jgi:hypothetical protein
MLGAVLIGSLHLKNGAVGLIEMAKLQMCLAEEL